MKQPLLLAIVLAGIAALCSGCAGYTTSASPVNSYKVKLGAVGSCDVKCEYGFRVRTSPNVPTEPVRESVIKTVQVSNRVTTTPFYGEYTIGDQLPGTINNYPPGTKLYYWVCGRELTMPNLVCVGPNGKTTDQGRQFTVPPR